MIREVSGQNRYPSKWWKPGITHFPKCNRYSTFYDNHRTTGPGPLLHDVCAKHDARLNRES